MLKKYRSHKVVHAEPMAYDDYVAHFNDNYHRLGPAMKDIEPMDPDNKGYLVIYSKGTSDEYHSWSPKDVFDKGYHEYTLGESKSSHSDKCSHPNGGPVGVLTSPSPFDATGNPMLKYFAYEHLPPHLQEVSEPIAALALVMNELPNCPEKSAGMRKLLEAKDCFVRAKLG
ncbi:hypothetical protein [Vibrio sp. ER1A]|uniref:hypothetical protein n=1 Tax=Vibrio sp. ER1A TaxID=1517681 RepID=UPI00056F3E4E|nr:hypothetical protein [Vibrio sp. ER1A]